MSDLKLIPFKVTHTRLAPKRYQFTHSFFWFKIDLNKIKSTSSPLFNYNRRSLYSFYDRDHIKLGGSCARENYILFAKQSGVVNEIVDVVIYTQVRFIGYVFNPVSFILLKDDKGLEYAIIEIGNTFNELKPYFVDHHHFDQHGFKFTTQKFFYISPFIDHDNMMTFFLKRKDENIFISISDKKEEQKILQVNFQGKEIPATLKNMLWMTLRYPFVTMQFIFFIHIHALILWLKKIRYFKKEEYKDLQRGVFPWKT